MASDELQPRRLRPYDIELPLILPRSKPGPAMLPRALTYDEVEQHRRLDCELYSRCLAHARVWAGFTCQGCPRYDADGHAAYYRWREAIYGRMDGGGRYNG